MRLTRILLIALSPLLYLPLVPLIDRFTFTHAPIKSLSLTDATHMFEICEKNPTVFETKTDDGQRYIVKRAKQGHSLSQSKLFREYHILQKIQEIKGASHLVGKISNDAFCITYIPHIPFAGCDLKKAKESLLITLDQLHALGIYHRDLKNPNNFLIHQDGTPFLIDFGNSLSLPFPLKQILGPFYSKKERITLLGTFFLLDPCSLTNGEYNELLFYKRLQEKFHGKRRHLLLEKLEEWSQ